jgi:hypothetical protein
MKAAPELVDGKQIFDFTFGLNNANNNETKFHLNLNDPFVRIASVYANNYENSIPSENQTPSMILLLKYNKKTDSHKLIELKLTKDANNHYLASPLTLERMAIIKSLLADIFVYGNNINDNQANDLASLHDAFVGNPESVIFSSAASDPQPSTFTSFPRCVENNYPFQMNGFRTATPGGHNDCTQPIMFKYPYSMQGIPLQRTAKKLVTNCLYSVKLFKADSSIFEGTPYDITATILGIHRSIITSINTRAEQRALLTPGKTRIRTCPVQVRIDEFDREKIGKFIVDSYNRSVTPLLRYIYNLLMTSKEDELKEEDKNHRANPVTYPAPGPKFTCSERTFQKILHIQVRKDQWARWDCSTT